MKLLIITQKVDKNDDLLGFFHDWLIGFSENFEKVLVICLEKREYNLSDNVEVLSLGKEKNLHHSHAIRRLASLCIFYKYIWKLRKEYDAVFVHMNPEYAVMGGLFWRLLGKKIILWYTHKRVDLKLRISEKLVNLILTASQESFNIKSKKIKILSHGINMDKFKKIDGLKDNKLEKKFRIIYVGRISQIKNQKMLVEAVGILVNKNVRNFHVTLFGRTITDSDKEYLKELKTLIDRLGVKEYFTFVDNIFHNEIVKAYNEADVNINLCPRGGVDKAVIESMACELPVIAANMTYAEDFGAYKDNLLVNEDDAQDLAKKIELLMENKNKLGEMGAYLRKQVFARHNAKDLIKKISEAIKS